MKNITIPFEIKIIGILCLFVGVKSQTTRAPEVVHGEIYTNNEDNNHTCNFIVNGKNFSTNDTKLPGLHFGMVKYDCNGATGILVSKFKECRVCIIPCKNNEYITSCQSIWGAGVIGVVLGSLLITTPLLLWKGFTCCKVRYRKQNSTIAEIFEVLELKNNPINLVAIIVIFGLPLVLSCDRILYTNSINKLCDHNHCESFQTLRFSMSDKMTVCLVNQHGRVYRVVIETIQEINSFSPIYRTSDFIVKEESYSECKVFGSKCWNPNSDGTCTDKLEHSPFQGKIEELRSRGLVFGTTCSVSPLGCDTWCLHSAACTWILWWVEPVKPYFTVFKKLYRTFQVEITVWEDNDNFERYFLSTGNPTVDKQHFIELNNVNLVQEPVADKLIILGEERMAYLMEGSEQSQPMPHALGDFQIQLKGNASIFPAEKVSCMAQGCLTQCKTSKSFMSSFDFSNRPTVPFSVITPDLVHTYIHRRGFVSIAMKLTDLDHLLLVRASCDFEILFSQGCTGCDQPTPIIFQATKILEDGVLQFHSDCEFESYLIPCQNEPTAIHMYGNPRICKLDFRSINKTIIIKPDYIFKGNLSTTDSMMVEGLSYITEGANLLSANPNFVTGLVSSMAVGTLSLIILRFFVRCCKFIGVD